LKASGRFFLRFEAEHFLDERIGLGSGSTAGDGEAFDVALFDVGLALVGWRGDKGSAVARRKEVGRNLARRVCVKTSGRRGS